MNLNLPFSNGFRNCRNILIAGAGGGFDILAGLPLYYELWHQGKNPHLFNYSFTDLDAAESELKITEPGHHLYTFGGPVLKCPERKGKNYFPEGYLAEFLKSEDAKKYTGYRTERPGDHRVYATSKSGVIPVRDAYLHLIKSLDLDMIILIDGGIDSLMRGNEKGCATILEDTVSLAALTKVDVKYKCLATIGFGTEIEDGLDHHAALRNMARLQYERALQGSCGLTQEQMAFQFMKEAYKYITTQPNHAESHITPRIIRAVDGYFGADSPECFIQPLMGLYLFWSPDIVAKYNILIDEQFCKTHTFTDVMMLYKQKLVNLPLFASPASKILF